MEKQSETRREIVVDGDDAPRLDVFLAEQLGVSRSRAAQLIESGEVRLHGAVPRKRDRPVRGDRIEVRLPAPTPSPLKPEALPLDILYQDADMLVLNKAAGMVVHPAPGHASGTLVNALLHHVGDLSGIGGVLRPGIVHRLDRDTSGLILVAKHDAAHRRLASDLKERRIRRSYLAAAWGHLAADEQRVEGPIGRHPTDRKRMAVVEEGGRPAATRFRRLERWKGADLVRAELETGRTHQIRVHLLHIGHPVVGDATYAGGRERGFAGPARQWAAELARRTARQFLHATELRFRHPISGVDLKFEAPLPDDLAAVASWARGDAAGIA
ncbi:MAG: RluA family pseudouridine synthase [Gemmatimonadetes bacterium]|nr:RluA family pseudouridine synthase [Gemmatimonadota bacterium]